MKLNTKEKKLFYFFIDGLGLDKPGEDNPVSDLFQSSLSGYRLEKLSSAAIFDRGVIVPLDPVQGVPGLPQSATGQTSLYTGINAQKVVGHHLTAIPNKKLIRLIRDRSLLKKLKDGGISVTSANLYSEEFFKRRSIMKKNMFPVSTLSIKAADIPFRMINEYSEKKALSADITNRFMNERGWGIDMITPEEGAQRIYNILEENQAVFFEYFMTDIYGHKRNREALDIRKKELDGFLFSLLKIISENPEISVLIVSDHGNVEDFSTGNHTSNPVPLILFTEDNDFKKSALNCRRLIDVYYLVLDYFGVDLK
jgi:hypothetical protein